MPLSAPTYPATYSGPTEDANAATIVSYIETANATVTLNIAAIAANLTAIGANVTAIANVAVDNTSLGTAITALANGIGGDAYSSEFVMRQDLKGLAAVLHAIVAQL